MTKPRIAITTGRRNENALSGELQNSAIGCNINYVNAVVRAGGAPLLLPRISDPDALRSLMQIVDGLLLTGGGDVLSLAYDEEPHPKSLYQDSIRDAMEIEVTRLALDAQIPILGVCRGIQILNVACGGSLIQDIPSEIEGAFNHYGNPQHPVLLHTIEIEPGSLLAGIVEGTTLSVNSYHHQAVKSLGKGLRVNSRARDRIIEGIESDSDLPILGVQFHPEEVAEEHPRHQAIFNWLIEMAQRPK